MCQIYRSAHFLPPPSAWVKFTVWFTSAIAILASVGPNKVKVVSALHKFASRPTARLPLSAIAWVKFIAWFIFEPSIFYLHLRGFALNCFISRCSSVSAIIRVKFVPNVYPWRHKDKIFKIYVWYQPAMLWSQRPSRRLFKFVVGHSSVTQWK